MVENKISRGLRNNNPFNIKRSQTTWFGEVNGNDKVFECFSSLELGVRAGLKLIQNYILHGYDSPSKILTRFAPYSENNTESYIRFVCDYTTLSPDVSIILFSQEYFSLCSAIIKFENGLSDEQLCSLNLSPIDLYDVFKRHCL